MTNCLSSAAVRMTLRYSFWTEIFYSMKVIETDEVETAATDGRTLWVNPPFWKTLVLDEQVAVLAHELLHKILLHCTRQGTRDGEVWNAACDYAVNWLLKENRFTLPKGHLYDVKYAGMLAEQIYADLLKQMKQQPGGAASGIPGVGTGWDKLRDIRQQQGSPEEIEKAETEIKALVDRAINNAKARGDLPVGIEAGVVEVYKPSQESWFNHLHRYMQSLSTSEYNWARLNRRTLRTHGVFTPLHLNEALGDIAIFIDTSGSCFYAAQQANFCGHLNAIMAEAKPRRVHLYSFDAEVYPNEVIEAGEIEIYPHLRGGGGTRFEPIFERIEEDGLSPELVLVLTDGYGSFPSAAPDYPVVWAMVSDAVAPFGETIHVQ